MVSSIPKFYEDQIESLIASLINSKETEEVWGGSFRLRAQLRWRWLSSHSAQGLRCKSYRLIMEPRQRQLCLFLLHPSSLLPSQRFHQSLFFVWMVDQRSRTAHSTGIFSFLPRGPFCTPQSHGSDFLLSLLFTKLGVPKIQARSWRW